MKFKDNNYTQEQLSLTEFISRNLDGTDYERGSVETAQATANNVSEAFTRLVEVLVKKDQLTKNDIYLIVKGYIPRGEEE